MREEACQDPNAFIRALLALGMAPRDVLLLADLPPAARLAVWDSVWMARRIAGAETLRGAAERGLGNPEGLEAYREAWSARARAQAERKET